MVIRGCPAGLVVVMALVILINTVTLVLTLMTSRYLEAKVEGRPARARGGSSLTTNTEAFADSSETVTKYVVQHGRRAKVGQPCAMDIVHNKAFCI